MRFKDRESAERVQAWLLERVSKQGYHLNSIETRISSNEDGTFDVRMRVPCQLGQEHAVNGRMKKSDIYKLAKLLHHKIIPGIVAIPAVLYFPHEVVEQLNELCRARGLTAEQLMAEAIKAQRPRFDQFIEDVMAPRKPGEPPTWPKDPLYCLACGTMRHFARNFLLLKRIRSHSSK